MLLLCLVFLFHGVRAAYEEKLMLRPLEDINQFLARFEFVVDEAFDLDDGASLFPNVLRQLLEKYDVKSLHLTFSVALIGDADVQQRWRGITSEMSGIFSASLNEMDETVVKRLLSSSIPKELGSFPATNADPREVLLHGSLAGEELCTENLTPWLMMLPCRTITGIGSLIDPLDALSGEYISLSLFASRLSDGGLMLQQDLTTVQRPHMHNRALWRLGSLFYEKIPSMILVLVPLQTRVLFIWRIRGVLSLPIFAKKPCCFRACCLKT
ncbi:hypothetical protein PsorP6_005763 [Peronosclerospora sorghi]|uniref:Uncharacterized protein n=1 Tax=Peronosclerospora sorghi TaxID=230839 RepID=A0ACC0W3M3_9STRA|nr:hypothetical protein PsorP6_005763 [Peronosclerospora sorghi]